MLKKIFIISGFFVLASLTALAADAGYFSTLDDLPLMPGMVERTDEAVIFDKPGGRIIEVSAETFLPAVQVKKFYADTLPSLGWKKISTATFIRDNEKLTLDTVEKNKMTIISFSLTPQHESK